jgi:hypothetical protein
LCICQNRCSCSGVASVTDGHVSVKLAHRIFGENLHQRREFPTRQPTRVNT